MWRSFCILVSVVILSGCQPSANLKAINGTSTSTGTTVTFSVSEKVSETELIAAKDLNNDGFDDFVIGFMIDPEAQIGIKCCEVPKNRLKDLRPLPIYLALSSPSGYVVSAIPESETIRTWAGAIFEYQGVNYLYLGRNGEISLPEDNQGERSILYKVVPSEDEVSFDRIWKADKPSITSSVSTHVTADGVYILENNYGLDHIFDQPFRINDTVMYRFTGDRTMTGINLSQRLKPKSADNYLELTDIDDDGRLDMLAASEVWKSLDGKSSYTSWPNSYVVLDLFNNNKKLKLEPARFGDHHAGMSIKLIKSSSGDSVIVETSTRFGGHQGGGFKGVGIAAYSTKHGGKAIKVQGKLNAKKGTFRGLHHSIIDDEPALVPGYYRSKPQFLALTPGPELAISRLPIGNFISGNKEVNILPLKQGKCFAYATTEALPQSKQIKIKVSECL